MNDFIADSFIEDEDLLGPLSPENPEEKAFQGIETLLSPNNDFIVDEVAEEQENQIKRVSESLGIAGEKNPEDTAFVNRLAKDSGLPFEVVEEDPKRVEQITRVNASLNTLPNAPRLSAKVEDPTFSRFLKQPDDYENLSLLEQLLTDIDVGLMKGTRLREQAFALEDLRFNAETEQEKNRLQHRIDQIDDELQKLSNQGGDGMFEAASQVVGIFAEGIPQVAAAGAVTAPLNPALGSSAEVFRQSAIIEGNLLYKELKDLGIEEEIASKVSITGGIFSGLLEIASFKVMTEPAKKALKDQFRKQFKKQVLKDISKEGAVASGVKTFLETGVKETGIEELQEGVQIASEEIAKSLDPKDFESITVEEIGERLFEVGKQTLKAMAVLGAPGGVVTVLNEQSKLEQAEQNQALFEALGQNVQESPLAENVPEAHREFVEALTAEGPVEDVYVDGTKLNEVFQESFGEDSATALEELGVAEEIDVAIESKGDVKIPIGVYSEKIARNPDIHNAVLQHSKFDPFGVTPFEAQEIRTTQESLQREGDKILADQATSQEFKASSETAFQHIRTELLDTGRFTNEQADINATFFNSILATQAKRTGQLPTEFLKKFGLQIRAEELVSDQVNTLNQADRNEREVQRLKSAFINGPEGVFNQNPEEFQDLARTARAVVPRKAKSFSAASKNAQEFINKPLKNKSTGLEASVSKPTLRKILSESAVRKSVSPHAHMQAASNIDKLFENAERKGLPRQDKNKDPNIVSIQEFFAPIIVDGEVLKAKLLVKEFVDGQGGNKVYHLEALKIEKPSRGPASVEGIEPADRSPSGREGLHSSNIDLEFSKINPALAEKLDENGGLTDETARELIEKKKKNELFQEITPDWYYSPLAEAVNSLPKKKAAPKSAADWKQIIAKLPGVKKSEIEWSGLNEWLDTQTKDQEIAKLERLADREGLTLSQMAAKAGISSADLEKALASENFQIGDRVLQAGVNMQKVRLEELSLAKARKEGKITREQISQFLHYNGVNVETITNVFRNQRQIDDAIAERQEEIHEELIAKEVEAGINSRVQDAIFENRDENGDIDFSALGVSDVEELRESISDELQEALDEAAGENETLRIRAWEIAESEHNNGLVETSEFQDYTLEGGENYTELLLTFPDTGERRRARMIETIKRKIREIAAELSSPSIVQDMPKYNSILSSINSFHSWAAFIRSSDFARFKEEGKAPTTFLTEEEQMFLNSNINVEAGERIGDLQHHGKFQSQHFDYENIVAHVRFKERDNVLFIEEIQSDFAQAVRKGNTRVRAPFVGKTEDWVSLAMKRMISYAVENNFDRIEWTTGLQQSRRYTLSDKVESIVWNERTGSLLVRRQDTDHLTQLADNVTKDNLDTYVGKNVAEKLIESVPTGESKIRSLVGEDFEVGSKGMSDFYDKLVPNIANKVVKSLTGEKQDIKSGDAAPDAYDPGRQPGFDMAPLREAFGNDKPQLALFQEKKGSFQFSDDITQDPSIINLFEKADLSTFLHESGHFWFEALKHLAQQPDATQQVRDDMNALLSFVGVSDLGTWNAMSIEERRAGHEQVARAFEAYLFEGNAPTLDLRNLFRRLRAWLIQVYKDLLKLNVTLSDDVRGVFDRMVATDEEIQLSREANEFQPIFENQEQAGMDKHKWKEYTETAIQEEEAADEELQSRSLKQMKWLHGARGRVLRQMQREQRLRRQGVKAEVSESVANEPVYKAITWLRQPVEKKQKIKSDPRKVVPEADSLHVAIGKLGGLDKDELVRMWGLDPKTKFSSFKPVARIKDGKSIDRIAEGLAELGYLPVDENGKWDLADFEERFFDEISGRKHYSVKNDQHDVAEAYEDFIQTQDDFTPTVENLAGAKLSIPSLIDLYGNQDDAIWKKLPKGRWGMVAEDGINPQVVASLFGFSSADEMIQAIANAKPMKEEIEAQADERMLELFGDMNTPKQREQALNEALHNEVRSRMVHAELSALSKRVGNGNVLARAAKEWAESKIASMKIRDIRPAQFLAAERRAGKQADLALARGDLQEATDHKRAQVLNYHFARAATKAVDEVDRAVRYFNKFDSKGVRQKIDIEYLNQVDQLLEQYDIRKSITNKELARRNSLAEWVKAEEAKGNNPSVDPRLLRESVLKHYRDVPMEELRGLRDTVKNIEHLGRLKNTLLLAQEQRNLDKAANEIFRSVVKHNRKKKVKNKDKTLSKRLPQDAPGRAKAGFYAEHRKLANMGRQADGFQDGGPFWKYIIKPMNERADWEAEQNELATQRLMQMFDVYSSTEFTGNVIPLVGDGPLNDAVGDAFLPHNRLYKRVYVPEIDRSISKMERIMMALNWGNEDNRQRLTGGFDFSADQVEFVLNGLDQRDWNFVQSVWDYFEEFWPEIKAKEERVAGVAPEKVEVLPVNTKFGQYRGGYFPITFDSDLSQKAHENLAVDAANLTKLGARTRATTKRGHTKERIDGPVNQPVRTDFGVIFEHVNQVIHDLAWHEFLIDTNKLLNHSLIQDSIVDHMGHNAFVAIQNTIKDIAAGNVEGQRTLERGMNYLRAGVSISAMGWNLGTALLQPLGLTQSMVRVGPKYMAKAMLKFFTGASAMEGAVADVFEKSSFMRLRGKTMNREINEIRNKIGRAGLLSKARGPIDETYFYLIVKAQQLADIPTWLAAEEKALAEGHSEIDAVALADQAVIDSQGSGHIKDLADVQRGSPIKKLFTNFMSYFQVTFNLTADSLTRAKFSNPLSVGRLAVDMFLLYTAPIALSWFLRDAWIKGECDHGSDLVCVAGRMAREHASYLVSGIMFFREANSAFQGFQGYQGPAGTRFFSDMTQLIKQTEQGEIDEAFLKSLNKTGGILFHYPAIQMEKLVTGYMDLQSGKTDNPAAPLFGVSKR